MIKRGAILLLLFALWTTAVRAYDFAATVPSGQTLYFSLVAGGVQVVYPNADNAPSAGWNGYTRPTGALTVPATISDGNNTYNVLSLGNHALYGCTGLTSVTLVEGITAVGNSAVRLCTSLNTITLPSSLSSIGDFAFVDDSALTDVWVSSPVPPTTGNNIFYNIALSACTLHVACNGVAAYSAVAPWSGFGALVDAG
ncbi:MAG: leucine-rich repeat domain-containing protein, partial [Bacteroidales bacterium]|nr:leucine-rich repeat domain-containing protein [Bacteroidales bacterium]